MPQNSTKNVYTGFECNYSLVFPQGYKVVGLNSNEKYYILLKKKKISLGYGFLASNSI